MRHVGLVALAVLGSCPGALAADLPAAVPVPATAPVVAPLPQESGRFTLIEENDALMPRPTDRWYTQGLELNYLSAPIAATGIDLRVGVNNLTGKAPPIIPSGSYTECPNSSCNDNTWVGTYDTLGRYLYAHVQVKF